MTNIRFGRDAPCQQCEKKHEGGTKSWQEKTLEERHRSMTWMQRLKRVFNIDIETCERCGAEQNFSIEHGDCYNCAAERREFSRARRMKTVTFTKIN